MMNDAINMVREDLPVLGSYVDTLNNRIVLEIEQEVFDKINNVDDKINLYRNAEYPEKEIPLIIQPASVTQLTSNHPGGQF